MPDRPDSAPLDGASAPDPGPGTAGGRAESGAGGDGGAVRVTAVVKGRVQGVGFRWWTRARALELGLRGSATNLDDGRVEVVAEGPREAAEALVARLRGGDAPGRVDFVAERWGDARGLPDGFVER